jgi:hypothetical protein
MNDFRTPAEPAQVKNGAAAATPQPLPYNLESERSTIGAMLIERQAAETAVGLLTVSDFYSTTHRIVFDCIAAMLKRGDHPDFITVSEELRRHDQLGESEGQIPGAYLQACIEACVSASRVSIHAKIVRELSQKRRAAILADKAYGHAMNGVSAGVALAEIRRSVEALEGEIGVTALSGRKPFSLLSLRELDARPAPEYLIYGVLVKGGTSLLTAKHASFKTFISLDMALCVASGTRWHDKVTKPGAVVYVAAEGAGGLLKRVRAWCMEKGCELPENFHVFDKPAQIGDPVALAAFIDGVAAVGPALIVLDTLARCAVGLDENSARDMGAFVEAVGRLAEETGAHVLTVHHNNKTGEYRGSSALVAAVDTHLSIERDGRGDFLTLKFEKQKDDDEAPPVVFTKKVVEWREDDGRNLSSLVFERDYESRSRFSSLSVVEEKVLRELCESYGPAGATSSQWENVCDGIVKRTFLRATQRLKDNGYVHCPEQGKRGAIFTPDLTRCAEFLSVTLVTNGDIAPNDTKPKPKVTNGDTPLKGCHLVTNGLDEEKEAEKTLLEMPASKPKKKRSKKAESEAYHAKSTPGIISARVRPFADDGDPFAENDSDPDDPFS